MDAAIDAARYAHPDHPRERPRSFAEADRSDRDYAFRLARAALRAASAAAEAEMTNERRNSDGLNRQARNPEEVPDAGPKVENAKAFQEGITGGQTSHRQVGMPRYVMSESKAIDWTKPIETRERLPRPAKYLGPVEGGTIDYVLVSIGEGDSSFHHPAGEYRALKDTGFIRGTIALRNVASAGPQAEADDFKLVYVKRWRTLVKLPTKHADEIVEVLRAHRQPQQADGRGAVIKDAIKALTGFFSILRGRSYVRDSYQIEISHGLYNELRDVRDALTRALQQSPATENSADQHVHLRDAERIPTAETLPTR